MTINVQCCNCLQPFSIENPSDNHTGCWICNDCAATTKAIDLVQPIKELMEAGKLGFLLALVANEVRKEIVSDDPVIALLTQYVDDASRKINRVAYGNCSYGMDGKIDSIVDIEGTECWDRSTQTWNQDMS